MGDTLLDILPLFGDETEEAIYARMAAYANEGVSVDDPDEWIDTRPGSHFFTWSQPNVRELARAYDLMGTEFVAAAIPVLSWGEYLDALAASYLVDRLEATPASGGVTFIGPVGLEVIAGARVAADPAALDEAQKEYEVLETGKIAAVLGAPGKPGATTESTGGGLADGDHFYVVTTVNKEGESIVSAERKVTLAVGGDGIVNLTWGAVVGATAYRVYHATAEGGPYSRLAEVTELAYKDDGSPAPDAAVHPPAEDTTGGRVTLPVEAVEAGVAFNANAGEVTVQVSESSADSVSNAEGIAGGTDPETDEALLRRMLERFGGIGAGNKAAYKVWAGEYPGVGRVTVIPNWKGPNTVLVIVLTADGSPVSAAIVEGLQDELDPVEGQAEGRAPVGHDVTVTTASGVTIDIDGEIEFEPGYSLDGAGNTIAMRDDLEVAARDYIDLSEPGGEVVRQKVIGRLVAFDGVKDVSGNLKLNGTKANVALDDDPAEVGELGTLTLVEANV